MHLAKYHLLRRSLGPCRLCALAQLPPLLHPQIHTPDSSRYWLADSYDERHAAGQEPMNIDKEFLRLWFRDHCDPYKDEVHSHVGSSGMYPSNAADLLVFEQMHGWLQRC